MQSRFFAGLTILAAIAAPCMAQNMQRRATMVGGNRDGGGKCTVEVVVDGAAEVEIRGDTATLRNLKGQNPQWRRFECSGVMPPNPENFRFAGVDGRGRQQLVRDPRNGGSAVVQIEDSDNGSEGYTFDIFWGGGGNNSSQDRGRPYDDRGRYEQGSRRGFSQEDAMRGCQDAVRQQARDRFDARDMIFRRMDANDNPGRRDSVNGFFDVRRRDGRDEAYRFSCSVNFDTGRVFDARIEPVGGDRGGNPRAADRAIQNCQNAVRDRLQREGAGEIFIESIRVDDRPGRNDWIVGNARRESRRGREAFGFSCSVDLRDGDVRNVDVNRR